MNIKKHIAMALVTGLLGMAMISGGTVAYFSYSIENKAEIVSGSLKLGIKENQKDEHHLKFKDLQPGDTFSHKFELWNDGTLPIGKIFLISSHEVEGEQDFGSQIFIDEFLVNGNRFEQLEGVNLDQINSNKIQAIPEAILAKNIPPKNKDEAGSKVDIEVTFKFFKDERNSQDKYQENTLDLTWIFEAVQED